MKFIKCLILLLFAGLFLRAFTGGYLLNGVINVKKFITASCPTIDISGKIITQPACDQSDGAIIGVVVNSTGTKVTYTWRNGELDVVGHSVDLKNIPAGVYQLEVSDNSGCTTPVFSPKILVSNVSAITIDDGSSIVKNETCNGNGAIVGIIVSNATTFEWHNAATGAIVSISPSSADLLGVHAGMYQLYAYNSTCQLKSKTYNITQGLQVPIAYDSVKQNPTCAGTKGSLTISLAVQKGQPKLKFFLADTSGAHITDGLILGDNGNPILKFTDLEGGKYNLFVQDDNNCTVLLGSYTLTNGAITIDYAASLIYNDKCNQHLGAISPAYTGVTKPPPAAQFTWTDLKTGQVVGIHKTLIRVGAGTYQLKIVDPANPHCIGYGTFTVLNISPSVVPPKAVGSTICLPGMINITVTNPDTAGTFKLYAAQDDSIPLMSNRTGIFYRQVDKTTDFYLARVHGDCESERTKVTETVVADIKIPNTFTPNNDGYNDYWNITGIEKFPGAEISVFTRSGQMVFHSINYSRPFDGTIHGSALQAGTYYYVIDVKQPICFGKIAGNLTIIR